MNKNVITGIAIAVALAVVGLFFVYDPTGVLQTSAPASTGLVVQDELVGTGTEARVGDTLTVNYTGKLEDGTVFDTSVGKVPYAFILGAGVVIPGWDQGLVGMKVGGKRLLIIPPALAYGAVANGPIPANSALIFEVELVKVEWAE